MTIVVVVVVIVEPLFKSAKQLLNCDIITREYRLFVLASSFNPGEVRERS